MHDIRCRAPMAFVRTSPTPRPIMVAVHVMLLFLVLLELRLERWSGTRGPGDSTRAALEWIDKLPAIAMGTATSTYQCCNDETGLVLEDSWNSIYLRAWH